MAAPVPLRSDFDAEALRVLAKGSGDPAQTRRLLALSVIAAGGSHTEAAEIGGVGFQTVCDWIVAFNADGPDGLIDGKAPGARPHLKADHREVLRALVEQGPMPAAHGVVRWRLCDLARILCEDHGVSFLRAVKHLADLIARSYCTSDGILEAARSAAEAQFNLQRVQAFKIALLRSGVTNAESGAQARQIFLSDSLPKISIQVERLDWYEARALS